MTGIVRMRVSSVVCALVGAAGAPACLGQQIYFADIFNPTLDDGAIRRVDLDGGTPSDVIITGGGLRSLDVDATTGRIYWCDVNTASIMQANIDGSNVEPLISTNIQFPAAIRIDHANPGVVWGDASAEEIDRGGLDGSGPFTVIPTPFYRGLTLDGAGGFVYWTTTITSTSGNIMRCTSGGANPVAVITGQGKPTGVAVDPVGGKVYWTDGVLGVVRRANLNGSGVQTLFGPGFPARGIALDLIASKVYWGQDTSDESPTGAIYRSDLDGSNLEFVATGLGLVNDLVIVRPPVCYPNCDGSTASPILNVADFTCFLQKFAQGCH